MTTKRRAPSSAWKPGQSGNPGGRPKDIAEVRDLARLHTAAAIAALVKIAETGKSESARVSAADALLDRGWGRPQQSVTLDGGAGSFIEELRAAEELYRARQRAADTEAVTVPPAPTGRTH